MSTALSEVAAVGCVALGAYGSWTGGRVLPLVASAAFSLLFVLARQRAADGKSARLQLPLVLALVCLSFTLHLVFLPAGLCCFFALMLCKNELLLPVAPKAATKTQ